MTDSDIIRLVRREVERQLQGVGLNGVTQDVAKNTEGIGSPFPGAGPVPGRPKVEPYGFHSMAPKGTLNFSVRGGADPGSRYVVGHRDANRPDLEEGESATYSFGGYIVKMGNGAISLGKNGEFETAVVGETLLTFLQGLLDAIMAHTHASAGTPPTNNGEFESLGDDYLSNDKILAKDGGRF